MMLQSRVRGGHKIDNQEHTQSEYVGESGLKKQSKYPDNISVAKAFGLIVEAQNWGDKYLVNFSV